jgi:parvulin-like peptidyl-prolyl isomerase
MEYTKRSKMKYFSLVLKTICAVSLLTATIGFASDQRLPIIGGKRVVAMVNGEPITLSEFNQGLAMLSHGVGGDQKIGEEKKLDLLRRLINTRLIIQEARRMGLDELKELKEHIDVFAKVELRDELTEKQIRNIKPDGKEVERIYREWTKEFKIKSIVFEKEEDANQMEGLLKSGKDFDEVSGKFLLDKNGRGSKEGNFLKNRALLPEIAEAASKMKIGSISPVIRIKSGYVIFKLEDVRFPENPEIRQRVKLDLLLKKQKEVLSEYCRNLKDKYAKVNEGLLKSLDFESKEPGFEKLMKDKRAVAEIKGEKPITVGDLADYMREHLYHGVEIAVESKSLNNRKGQTLDEMVQKRILRKEALRLGIDKTEDYKKKVKEYENSLIFGTFVQKAVAPDIKLGEEELRTYYNEHIKDYTYPEMMKISSLVFAKRDDAEKAIIKLRKGTDFQWVKENAENQVSRNTVGILNFNGKLLTTKDLPKGVGKAVSGAKSGDFRLYESPENHFYVLYIQETVPSRPQPYNEAKGNIARKIYDKKLTKAAEEYADKLRAVSDVKVYLKGK